MCRPASFVVTKDHVFWSRNSDSHEDIIDEYGLHEDGVYGPNIVRVEIAPEDGNLSTDPSAWKYKLDQDTRPAWYDQAEAERRCRGELPAWLKSKVIINDRSGRHLKRGSWYVYDSTVNAFWHSRVRAFGRSAIAAYDRSFVRAFGHSTVDAYDRCTVRVCRKCTVVAYNESTIEAHGNSAVEAWGGAVVRNYTERAVVLHNEAVEIRYLGGYNDGREPVVRTKETDNV